MGQAPARIASGTCAVQAAQINSWACRITDSKYKHPSAEPSMTARGLKQLTAELLHMIGYAVAL